MYNNFQTFVAKGVNMNIAADTTIATPVAGFIVLFTKVHYTTVTSLTGQGTFNIGTNSATYTNINNSIVTGTTAVTNTVQTPAIVPTGAGSTFVPAGTAIKLHITTGTTATVCTADVYVFGFFTT